MAPFRLHILSSLCEVVGGDTNNGRKKSSLMLLGITAIICSRTLFFFFNDPEGPNLLVVAGLAIAVYSLSSAAYLFGPSKPKGITRISGAICLQILSVIGLYFCMK